MKFLNIFWTIASPLLVNVKFRYRLSIDLKSTLTYFPNNDMECIVLKNCYETLYQKLGGNLKQLCFGTDINAYTISWIDPVVSNSRSFKVGIQ